MSAVISAGPACVAMPGNAWLTATCRAAAAADGVEVVAKFFRGLSDPARLRLLEFLLGGEHTVTECVARISLSQGRVSSHLACLAGCGYVESRRQGRFTYYKVADPRVADLVMLARSSTTPAPSQRPCGRS
jgi:DNA-binding transcriptional ArsR family regulator